MFAGGFSFGRFLTPSLLVGGGLGISFNALPADGCGDDDLRLTMSAVLGPMVDWYPLDRGFHVTATAGYASHDDEMTTSHGIGAALGVGYDWFAFSDKHGAQTRLGVLAQITAIKATHAHATLSPALLFTIAVD
jgi:hypothetical protein